MLEQSTRGQFRKQLTAVVGVSGATALLSGSNLASAMTFVGTPTRDLNTGQLFSFAQFNCIKAIIDTILPRTDTPSGSEGCDQH